MNKPSIIATLVGLNLGAAISTANAMNPQPDSNNPNGYVVADTEVQAAEDAQTSNPMYDLSLIHI